MNNSSELIDSKYYNAVLPHSLAERVIVAARDRIYGDFLRLCRPRPGDLLLDVGASDFPGGAANVMERCYPHPERLTAVGLGSAESFHAIFPRIAYWQIEPHAPLPFPDKSFDIVTANAVLEHVGSVEEQRQFLSELLRVGRRIFVTVPNRFFPVEHHTAIPFLHWADTSFMLACRLLGKDEWRHSENLILMSRRRLRRACPETASLEIGNTGINLGPLSSNLYLYGESSPSRGFLENACARIPA